MVFVDTGAWYACLVPSDPDHAKAVQWFRSNYSPLLTTDYVIDETLTLFRARGEKKRALLLGARFFDESLAKIHKISGADLKRAWSTFEQFNDKNWSFPDCTSKVSPRDEWRVANLSWARICDGSVGEYGSASGEPGRRFRHQSFAIEVIKTDNKSKP